MKGDFVSYCFPYVFGASSTCMFAWCPKCYKIMDDKKEGRSETSGRRQKRARAKESTTEVTGNSRGDCKIGHTMEDTRHLYCNDNQKDLKRNRRSRGNKERPLVVDICWVCGKGF